MNIITIIIMTIITLGPEDKVMEFPHKVSRLELSNLSTSSSTLLKRTNALSSSF